VSAIHEKWREEFRPLIERAIAETGLGDPKRLRAALRAAYPLPWARLCPGRVWQQEARRAIAGELPPEQRGQIDLFAGLEDGQI
jgi:hypothetical protein